MNRPAFLSLPARRLARAAPVAAGLALAAAVIPAGAAAALPSNCSQSGATVTCTFATPGTGQSFTVPAGVSSLSVTLYGGVGGTNFNGDQPGGDGAGVTADLSTSPGALLGIDVGGAGGGGTTFPEPGGVNGGGSGRFSGGGGGATDVTSGGTDLLVAGGGGGAGANKEGESTCISAAKPCPAGLAATRTRTAHPGRASRAAASP